MYIQITDKCNMSCEHCAYACGPNGKHMSRKTFDAALKLCDGDYISIGGGEPTLHPYFWEFLARAIGTSEYVWLATNGSQTETSLVLAKMAEKGVIGCALSQDEYHDPIDPRVIAAFTNIENLSCKIDGREIRTVTKSPQNLAPFRNPKDGGYIENCPCEDLVIKPNGKVKFCGCRNSLVIGDVFKGFEKPEESEEYECWTKYQKSIKI